MQAQLIVPTQKCLSCRQLIEQNKESMLQKTVFNKKNIHTTQLKQDY